MPLNLKISSAKIRDTQATDSFIDFNGITPATTVQAINDYLDEHPELIINIDDNSIGSSKLMNDSITTDKILDAAVTADKILDSNITSQKIADSNVITSKIQNGAITTEKISNSAITTEKINNGAITNEKIPNNSITSNKLITSIIANNATSDLVYESVDTYFLSYTRPEFFGAIANDSTHDDTAAIQTAINTGKKVIFRAGKTYLVNGVLKLLSGTHLDLNTATFNKTIVGPYFENFNAADATTVYNGNGNIVIENGILRNGGSIRLAHASNVIFKNIVFHRGKGYHFMELCACDKVKILDCEFRGMASQESSALEYINFDDASEISFPYYSENSTSYDGTPCQNIIISNCYFHFNDDNNTHKFGHYAIGCHYKSELNTSKHKNIVISNNHIEDFTVAGLNLNNMDQVFVTNNIIKVNGTCINIGQSYPCSNIFIDNNQLINTKTSYTATHELGTIYIGNVTGININKNTLYSSKTNSLAASPALINILSGEGYTGYTLTGLQKTWITELSNAGVTDFSATSISPDKLNTLYIQFINTNNECFEVELMSKDGVKFASNETHIINAIQYDSTNQTHSMVAVPILINSTNSAIKINDNSSTIKMIRVAGALNY